LPDVDESDFFTATLSSAAVSRDNLTSQEIRTRNIFDVIQEAKTLESMSSLRAEKYASNYGLPALANSPGSLACSNCRGVVAAIEVTQKLTLSTPFERDIMAKRAQRPHETSGQTLTNLASNSELTIVPQRMSQQDSIDRFVRTEDDVASVKSVSTFETIRVLSPDMQRRKFEKICAFLGEVIEPSEITNEIAEITQPKKPLTALERKDKVRKSDKLEKLFGQVPPPAAFENIAGRKHRGSIIKIGMLMEDSTEMLHFVHQLQDDPDDIWTSTLEHCNNVEDFAQYIQDLVETNLLSIVERGIMSDTTDEAGLNEYRAQLDALRLRLKEYTGESAFRFNALVVEACRECGKTDEETEAFLEEMKQLEPRGDDRQAKRKQVAKLEAFFGDRIIFDNVLDREMLSIREDDDDTTPSEYPQTDNDLDQEEKRKQTKRAKKLAVLLGQAIPEDTIKTSLNPRLKHHDVVSMMSSHTEQSSNSLDSSLLMESEASGKESQRRQLNKLSDLLGEHIRVEQLNTQAAGPVIEPLSEEDKRIHIKRLTKLSKMFGGAPPQAEHSRAAIHRASIQSVSDLLGKPEQMLNELMELLDDEDHNTSGVSIEAERGRKRINKLNKFFGDTLGLETLIEHNIIQVLEERINADDLAADERNDLKDGIQRLRTSLREYSTGAIQLNSFIQVKGKPHARRKSETSADNGLSKVTSEDVRSRSRSYHQADFRKKQSVKSIPSSILSGSWTSSKFITRSESK